MAPLRGSESGARARREYAARRGSGEQDDVGALHADGVAGGKGWRLLDRLEIDERRLVVEVRLEQIHLGLQQVALRLGDEERGRESHLEAALLSVEALLGQRRARACGVHTFGRALYLPGCLTDRLGGVELEARDPLCRLAPLNLRAGEARFFETAPERGAHRDAKTPCRVIRAQSL